MLMFIRGFAASSLCAGGALIAMPAAAQSQLDPPAPIEISAEIAVVSDYRFRGISQSDEEIAIQGGITAEHESGVYAGVWGSSLAGWGSFGGSNVELDLIAGYAMPIGGAVLDVGLTYYMYPGGADESDFVEPYATLSYALGPAQVLAGVAYAPKQEALANVSATPASRGQSQDNLYLWSDLSAGIPNTALTLNGHIGYSEGNPGLGPNGTSIAPTGSYLDWRLGADYALGPVVLSLAYVDTDISRSESAYLLPGFANSDNGSSIASSQVVFGVSAGF